MNSPYNIDALRRSDGTYNTASPRLIAGALRCGHTAHLQTGLGIIAIRPFTLDVPDLEGERGERRRRIWPNDRLGQNWLVEFYPGGERDGLLECRGSNFELAMEFIYRHLNGEDHAFTAGDRVDWYSNQATRDATVLAVIGDDLLLEYQMPGTTSQWRGHPAKPTSALVVCQVYGVNKLRQVRNVTHRKCPQYWLQAIHNQGMADEWIGAGQREQYPVAFDDIFTGETA